MFLCNFLFYKLDHCVVLYLWNNDWTNLYLPYLRMLPHKLQVFFFTNWFIRKRFFKIFLYIFLCKSSTPYWGRTLPSRIMIWTNSIPHKLQVFWLFGFSEDFLNTISIYSHVKNRPLLLLQPTLRVHDLNKLEFILPEDASTQVQAFLANWFLRRRFLKDTNKF